MPALSTNVLDVLLRVIALLTATMLSLTCGNANSSAQAPTVVERTADQEQAVRQVVTEFGRRLRMVAVLAPKEMAAKAMDEEYSAYVSADLLAAWKSDPAKAPGKQTSSPWPTGIEINSVMAKGADAYVVKGKVTLRTTSAVKYGGLFQANPVIMTVARQHGRWVITGFEEDHD